ncbi:MAG TPA: TlpA disulfide reductase family protein [Flavisolibacter sp.]
MRAFSLLLFSLCLALASAAQGNRRVLDEKTIVKDSSGTVYPMSIWQPLLMKGYTLKPENPGDENTSYWLVKMSPEQLKARLEKMPKPRESQAFTTGKKLSLFNAHDINGEKLNLRNLKGKIVVLNFWFVDCRPCRLEIPDLNELVDSFKTNDQVIFAAIALDDRTTLENFLKLTPFHYRIVDNGRFIADGYRVRSYPTHVVIDQEGKVYFHTTGLASNTVYWVRKSINELLDQVSRKDAKEQSHSGAVSH